MMQNEPFQWTSGKASWCDVFDPDRKFEYFFERNPGIKISRVHSRRCDPTLEVQRGAWCKIRVGTEN